VHSAQAIIARTEADIQAAEVKRSLADVNLRRARTLFERNATSQAEVDARQAELDGADSLSREAQAHLAEARASLAVSHGNLTLADGRLVAAGTTGEQEGAARSALALAEAQVARLQGLLKLAEQNLTYTKIRAARRGLVSRRSVEEGQVVGTERPLMAIVPVDDVWVVANFKEDQLEGIRPGAAARVTLDTYRGRSFAGHVESVSGGAGARFALLPPDNASGNFIKVTQRVAVLVRLDGTIDVDLRPGTSAEVTVDTAGH
jgi:membrane fusion protein (multidrug efflux system)